MNYMDYIRVDQLPTIWCAGCGYGHVLKAIAMSFAVQNLSLDKTVVVSGIGCWGQADKYLRTNAFHGTHGRALAFATGIKLANPELHVLAVIGDGDGVTIGGNHFIHACRRNVDVTAVLCNNLNYGMTGGQYSGTTPEDSITTTSPYGHIEPPFDICQLAIAAGAHYVARSLSEEVNQMTDMITAGMERKGFSLIEAVSACPTHYGRRNGMPRPYKQMQWLKQQTIPVSAMDKLTPEQLGKRQPVGVLLDKAGVDYSTRYQAVMEKAQER